MKDVCYLLINGDYEDKKFYYENLISNDEVYCADGGANNCYKLGIIPKEIWGDMDSVEEKVYNFYKEKGVKFNVFDRNKDFSDTELLLEYLYSKFNRIYVLFAKGSEVDHFLTNINLLFKFKKIIFSSYNEDIFLIENSFVFENKLGKNISFIPYSNVVKNLTLEGFKYNISNRNIDRGTSLCLSNVIKNKIAKIKFDEGMVIAIIKNI